MGLIYAPQSRPVGLRSKCKWQIRSEKPQYRRVIFKIKTYPVLQCTTEQKNWNNCLFEVMSNRQPLNSP